MNKILVFTLFICLQINSNAQTIPSSLNYTSAEQISIDYAFPYLNENSSSGIDKTIKYRISVVAKNATTQTAFNFYFGNNVADPVLSSGSQANYYIVKSKLLESDFENYRNILNSKDIGISYQDLINFPPTVRINKNIK